MKRILVFISAFCMLCANTNVLAQKQDQTFTVKGVSFTMKFVKGGTFMMGYSPEKKGGEANEKPSHKVTVSDFYMAETEVTQGLWIAVMDSAPSYNGGWTEEYGLGADYPAYRISWTEAQLFIKKISELTGKTFRLPTEAEWEYAARGGYRGLGYVYSGSNDIDEVAWYSGNSMDMTHPVKLKKANELGLYDMSGNVWEWCQDWYGLYKNEYQSNPTGPAQGKHRVDRGGGWNRNAEYNRVSTRCYDTEGLHNRNLGFRIMLVP